MPRSRLALVLACVALGVFLAPERVAEWRSDAPELAERLRGGAWIARGALALLAVLIPLGARFLARAAGRGPLLGIERPRPAAPAPREVALVAALAGVALALRWQALDAGPWFDEIDTWVHYARLPFVAIATTFDSQNQHLLYSLSAHAAFELFGEGAATLRLPAVLFGAASVVATYAFGRRVAPRAEAFAAAAFLACSYHHVWFSQNARGYTALAFFCVVGSGLFLRLLTEPGRGDERRAWGYGAAMALAVLTHATAALVVVAHALLWAVAWLRARRGAERPSVLAPALAMALATALSLLGYALVLPQFVETLTAPTMGSTRTEWKSPLWLATEALAGLAAGLPGGWFALGVGLWVAGLGVWSYARQGRGLLALLFLPAAVTLGAILALGHNLWPRFFFFSAGFAALVAVRGVVEQVRIGARGPLEGLRGHLTALCLVLTCLASASTVPRAWGPKQDFEGALAFVEARRRPGDAVVAVEMTTLPYEELYAAGWSRADSLDELLDVERAHPRTWVVWTVRTHLEAVQPAIWARLQEAYRTVETRYGTIRGLEVVVALRDAQSPPNVEHSR